MLSRILRHRADQEQVAREAADYYGSRNAYPCLCGHGLADHKFIDFGEYGECGERECKCREYREALTAA